MQEKKRRSNEVRTAEMRSKLLSVARALFVSKGYAETSTPEIVRSAGVTRGALYHHFEDKLALFRAVVASEAAALTAEIDAAATATGDAQDGLAEGTRGFFAAMTRPGRVRLLLIDGPAVLGWAEMDALDAGNGRASLKAGLRAAAPNIPEPDLEARAQVLSAAYDRAAMAISDGADPEPYVKVLLNLVERA